MIGIYITKIWGNSLLFQNFFDSVKQLLMSLMNKWNSLMYLHFFLPFSLLMQTELSTNIYVRTTLINDLSTFLAEQE